MPPIKRGVEAAELGARSRFRGRAVGTRCHLRPVLGKRGACPRRCGRPTVTEALFGITNPGGKLPYSMPRHSGQVPIYLGQHNGSGYRRTATDMHKGYRDMPATPLFAFGHGLSYTSFD